ncbi:MAG: multi-sensor signal transduction histidine kinase [Cyanobacteria bacterium RYN_339]|nr:multi-sensor signal transduction histidine kinase [Cyanobacteria bacterium RYN_339]
MSTNYETAATSELGLKLSELTAIVGHDLRNPLGSLMLSMEGLAETLLPQLQGKQADDARFFFEMARRSTRRLMRLTDDLVDNHRLLAGGLRITRKPCLVADLVLDTVAEMQGLADQAGVELVGAPAGLVVWGDYDRLVQLLTNLVANAIKFSPRGGRVELVAEERGGEMCLAVIDQGRGIPSQQLATIFQAYVQVEEADATLLGGSGLGLAICRTIAAAHGGRIWAESEPARGATITLALPMRSRRRR